MFKIGFSFLSNIGYVFALFLLTISNCYSWTIEDSFEAGTLGEKISLPGVPEGDAVIDAQGATLYSKDMALTGSQSAQLNIEKGKEGFGGWGARWKFPQKIGQGEEIWVRLRVFFPDSFNFTTDFALKFLRLHVGTAEGGHLGYTDIYINNDLTYKYQNELYTTSKLTVSTDNLSAFQVGEAIVGRTSGASATIAAIKEDNTIVYENPVGEIERWEHVYGKNSGADAVVSKLSSNSVLGFGANDKVKRGTWETVYYNVKYGSETSTVKFWKVVNGEIRLLMSDSTDKTLKSPTDKVDAFLLFTYWNGTAPQTQFMYVDDLWLSTEMPPEFNSPKPPSQIEATQPN